MNSSYPSLSLLIKAASLLQASNLYLIEAQANIAAAHKKCGYIVEWPTYDRITREIDREIDRLRRLVQSGQFEIEVEDTGKSNPYDHRSYR
jgi:hypothetical protein